MGMKVGALRRLRVRAWGGFHTGGQPRTRTYRTLFFSQSPSRSCNCVLCPVLVSPGRAHVHSPPSLYVSRHDVFYLFGNALFTGPLCLCL